MTPELRRVARRQAGAFTVRQALACGTDADVVAGLRLAGEWLEPHRGVLVCAGTPVTEQLRMWAALLAVGQPVALSALSAAWWYGLEQAPEPIRPQLVIPNTRDVGEIAGVDIRRVVPHRWQVVWRRGVPVSPLSITLRDCAPHVHPDRLRDIVQHALRRRQVNERALVQTLGRGLHGSTALRAVLEELAPGYQAVWEARLHRALLRAGVVLQPQVEVEAPDGRRAFIDLGDRELRFGVEIDGFLNHMARFAEDRRRTRLVAIELGWLLAPYAVEEIAADMPGVVSDVKAHLERLRRRAA
jgi:very-short-patch-repair endonuclease